MKRHRFLSNMIAYTEGEAERLLVLVIALCMALEYACVAQKRDDQEGGYDMETKGITCKIPLELHNRISEDIRDSESTMSKFIEMVINEHYTKGANGMSKMRTMAFQVSEEFFQRIKDYLLQYEQTYGKRLSQKEFVIGLIEQALEEADEEFEAARAAQEEASAESECVDAQDSREDAGGEFPDEEEQPDTGEEYAASAEPIE